MRSCVLTPDFEQQFGIGTYRQSIRGSRKARRKERASTSGPKWFNVPAPEQTEQVRNDLEVLRTRSVLDPKMPLRNKDLRRLPKHFHTGTIVESAAEFYNARVPKRQRAKTLVDELLQDSDLRRYRKRKYDDFQRRKYQSLKFKRSVKNKLSVAAAKKS